MACAITHNNNQAPPNWKVDGKKEEKGLSRIDSHGLESVKTIDEDNSIP